MKPKVRRAGHTTLRCWEERLGIVLIVEAIEQLPIGKREFDAERDEGAGECAAHPSQHLWT